MRIDWRHGLALVFLLIILTVLVGGQRQAAWSGMDNSVAPPKSAEIIRFDRADFQFSNSPSIPVDGWLARDLPDFKLLKIATRAIDHQPVFWARIRFDRAAFGDRALALNSDMIRDDFAVYLNGVMIYRSGGEAVDNMVGWNHPLFVPLPPAMLRPGSNEIVFHVNATHPKILGISSIRVGSDSAIRATYNRQYFLGNVAPQVVSGYLLILTIGALSFWARKPGELTYGWLALLGAVWIFRNLHYFVQATLFDPETFWSASTDSLFVLIAVVFGFAISYFTIPRARMIQLAVILVCSGGIVWRHWLVQNGDSELPSFLLSIPVAIALIALLLRASLQSRQPQHWLMLSAIVLALACSFHDLFYSFNLSKGAGVYLQPFGGLLIFAAFDIALTSRLQNALMEVEDVNLQLEARVASVTANLAASEAAHAELQIARAVDGERERIMREIHDGIGSGLLTALAQAKHRNESPATIATLKRSLTDLRIGVDSLEPIGGDVVALLANLRHRMERELKDAGLSFVWRVEAAPLITWLDPVGALHILRILQETIGNTLAHSDATTIDIMCRAAPNEGAAGIIIEIRDNGRGFNPDAKTRGKGLSSMAARAEALGACYSCSSEPGQGTLTSLWLPLELQ